MRPPIFDANDTDRSNDDSSHSTQSIDPSVAEATSSTSSTESGTSTSSDSTDIIRDSVGSGMITISDIINNNLVAFRYGTVATVSLLTVYGLSHTPLFHRYKSVIEIPATHFQERKKITARMVGVGQNDQAGQPVRLFVRHLSPAGRFLNKDLYEMAMKWAPSAQVSNNNDDNKRKSSAIGDVLQVEIAGIAAPPNYSSNKYQRGDWLHRLAEEKTVVKLQLLGRRVITSNNSNSNSNSNYSNNNSKRDVTAVLPELQYSLDEAKAKSSSQDQEQIVVCKATYRPTLLQLLPSDLARTLVRYGHASVESELYMNSQNNQHVEGTKVKDATDRLDELRKDIQYLNRLEKAEFQAAQGQYGMWSDPAVRDKRRDIYDEIEFQANANVFQKIWRWLRG